MVTGSPEIRGEVAAQFVPQLSGAVISGKYGPELQPAYETKQLLAAAGINVAFPVGNEPVAHYNGYTFSSPDEEYIPFQDMQLAFFNNMTRNPYHIVCPGKTENGQTNNGYLGFSTSHEVAWAVSKAKPIILTAPITEISRYVPQALYDIILDAKSQYIVQDLRDFSAAGLISFLSHLPETVDYSISDTQKQSAFSGYCKLLRIEKHRWLSWAQKTERDYVAGLRPNWINERQSYLYEEPAAYLPMPEMLADPDAQKYMSSAHLQHTKVILF